MRVDDSYRNATYYVVMQHIMLFCEMTKIPSVIASERRTRNSCKRVVGNAHSLTSYEFLCARRECTNERLTVSLLLTLGDQNQK